MSSSDPNVQQITASLKPAFIPRPGYLIADLDLSQIELRIGAFVSGSEPMRQAYFDGLDLHVLIAARTTGKAPEDVLPEERQRGKAGNFGFLFGMGADGFRTYAETNYGVTLTAEEAQESRDAFFDQWEGLASWHNKAILTAQRTGQVVSPIGRVRRLPHIWSNSDYLRSRAERNAINSPVQGLGSDIMQIGAASIAGNLPGHAAVPDVHLVGTVHDSIVAEVPEDDWARATGRMMRRMIEVPATLAKMGCSFDIPLEVEAKIGTRWGLADIGIIK